MRQVQCGWIWLFALVFLLGCRGEPAESTAKAPSPPAASDVPRVSPGNEGEPKSPDSSATSPGEQQSGESPAGTPDAADEPPGLKLGSQAPDFELKDQAGTPRSLRSLLSQGKVALVFYRSADW